MLICVLLHIVAACISGKRKCVLSPIWSLCRVAIRKNFSLARSQRSDEALSGVRRRFRTARTQNDFPCLIMASPARPTSSRSSSARGSLAAEYQSLRGSATGSPTRFGNLQNVAVQGTPGTKRRIVTREQSTKRLSPRPSTAENSPLKRTGSSRRQGSGHDSASRKRLGSFHRENLQFSWPSNSSVQKSGDGDQWIADLQLPFSKTEHVFLESEAKCDLFAAESTKAHGLSDWIAIKRVVSNEKTKHDAWNEVQILRKLRHNHIVAYLQSYWFGPDLYILMFPFAACDLAHRLNSVSQENGKKGGDTAIQRRNDYLMDLRKYFACLCGALRYLHGKSGMRIKHKDIKPANILIDRYRSIVLTDFGISKRYETQEETMTSGQTKRTTQYAPREVLNREKRGLSADVYSMGCVFMEMATVILGETLDHLRHRIASGSIPESSPIVYCRQPERVKDWIQNLQDLASKSQDEKMANECLPMVQKMLADDPKGRPEAQKLWDAFKDFSPIHCDDCEDEVSTAEVQLRVFVRSDFRSLVGLSHQACRFCLPKTVFESRSGENRGNSDA